jgi:hypothetical protein
LSTGEHACVAPSSPASTERWGVDVNI